MFTPEQHTPIGLLQAPQPGPLTSCDGRLLLFASPYFLVGCPITLAEKTPFFPALAIRWNSFLSPLCKVLLTVWGQSGGSPGSQWVLSAAQLAGGRYSHKPPETPGPLRLRVDFSPNPRLLPVPPNQLSTQCKHSGALYC